MTSDRLHEQIEVLSAEATSERISETTAAPAVTLVGPASDGGGRDVATGLTQNSVGDESAPEIHRRYGLERVVVSDPQEIIAKLNLQTFANVMSRPERLTFDYDSDWQSDDVKSLPNHRSALLDSIEESHEILSHLVVDEHGSLMDGFRRFLIATALNIKDIPFVILKGWRGDPHRVLALKRSYIREVNTTGRVLNPSDRRELAKKLLGEDEQRYLAGVVQHRQSYGLIACQAGLSQQTVKSLEKDHFYVRYRARCEGEKRLRGDGRLRSTALIPSEKRIDQSTAWNRGLGGITPKRSLAGLREAAAEQRKTIEELPEDERHEKLALLEDALAVLTPVMKELDRQRAIDKEQKRIKEEEQAKTRASR